MDKKILSAAIAGVLAGSMAFAATADVTLYGRVDASVDAIDVDDDAGGDDGFDDINMNSNQSRLGVKGSEDLGNGLKAIFQMEYEANVSGTTSAQGLNGGRDQWVGLQGGFGKIRLGTMSTSYKSHGALVDPIYSTSLQGRGSNAGMPTMLQSGLHNGSGENGAGRMTNHLRYDTADYNGFSATVDYQFDENESATDRDDDTYGFGAQYKNGPALIYADYITSDHGGADDAWKVGGSYSFGAIGLYGQYEMDGGLISGTQSEDPTVTNLEEDADVWFLGGTYTMGNAMLYLAYGQGDDSNDPTYNAEYDTWTLAGTYNFSKRTMVYTGFQQVSFDEAGAGEVDHFAVGMRHKF